MKLEMQKKTAAVGNSTQSFLHLSEIRKDSVILDNGTLRAIISVGSTNFDLKSQDEQNAIIMNFQRFLNSLEFPIQILMQSRKMEIGGYLQKLKGIAEKQTNELLRVQTQEYIEFISRLIENASIMNKSFYVIVPLDESIMPPAAGFFSSLLGKGKTQEVKNRVENFERLREKLDNRVTSVISNLSSIGLQGERLKNEQITQLYYNSYNFDAAPTMDASKIPEMNIAQQQSVT